jgi:hypothetical protein
MICAKSDQNWPSGSGEEVENVKVYRQTDRRTDGQTDDGQWAIRIAHLSFQLRWAKNMASGSRENYQTFFHVMELFGNFDIFWFRFLYEHIFKCKILISQIVTSPLTNWWFEYLCLEDVMRIFTFLAQWPLKIPFLVFLWNFHLKGVWWFISTNC